MKRSHLVWVVMAVFAVVLVFSLFKAESQKKTNQAVSPTKISQTSVTMPDSVAVFLRNSCSSCHGDGGSAMAKSIWNFSKWSTYTVKEQADNADAICTSITDESMPPKSVKKANPEKIPTAAQIKMVCKWATSLQGK